MSAAWGSQARGSVGQAVPPGVQFGCVHVINLSGSETPRRVSTSWRSRSLAHPSVAEVGPLGGDLGQDMVLRARLAGPVALLA